MLMNKSKVRYLPGIISIKFWEFDKVNKEKIVTCHE